MLCCMLNSKFAFFSLVIVCSDFAGPTCILPPASCTDMRPGWNCILCGLVLTVHVSCFQISTCVLSALDRWTLMWMWWSTSTSRSTPCPTSRPSRSRGRKPAECVRTYFLLTTRPRCQGVDGPASNLYRKYATPYDFVGSNAGCPTPANTLPGLLDSHILWRSTSDPREPQGYIHVDCWECNQSTGPNRSTDTGNTVCCVCALPAQGSTCVSQGFLSRARL